MNSVLYYLPGMGGSLNKGLGQGLRNRGLEITGRETIGEFRKLRFQDQLDIISEDLVREFWTKESRILANSFGAYLFLHAQAQLDPFPGRVLILSPIVGEFGDEKTKLNFIPPRSGRLFELAQTRSFPTPANIEAHVGSEDWQSNPEAVSKLGQLLNFSVTVVPGGGHNLGVSYVSSVLDNWLSES